MAPLRTFLAAAALLMLNILPFTESADAQVQEPEVLRTTRTVSLLNEHYGTGFGFGFVMNNFGFGVGGEYRKVVARQTELTASLRITGLRDASEQTFTDFFWGQQVIPNKYQRAMAFPLMLGMRQRVFPGFIQENYRFFLSGSLGVAAAFSYPYFRDLNDNGYREQFQDYFEPVNDIFSRMGEGSWHWGTAGEVKVGVDIGSNFSRLSSIEFGYYFYYFPNGIQIMMPNQPDLIENPQPGQNPIQVGPDGNILLKPFFDPQKFFGTPQITFTFGWLW
ncbi:MAG TPA: hypothetical protein VK040_09395 [Balneolaceae bacterium]|nr:hypothetical protein [Balneolaceae bacterium]